MKSKGSALAVPRTQLARATKSLPAGSQARVRVGEGECAVQMVYVGFDRKTGSVTYALRFVNESPNAMQARVICVNRNGKAKAVGHVPIDVAPHSVKDSIVPVRLADVGRYERAIVEVEGAGIAFSVDAAGPPAPTSVARRSIAWVGVALCAVLALALGMAALSPRLALFAPPARALAGQRIDIPFVRAGVGTLHYDLSTTDGRQIAAGVDAAQQGVIHVTLPSASTVRQYRIRGRVDGPLGSAARSATIVALLIPPAPPKTIAPKPSAVVAAAAPPPIQTLSVAPSPVRAGTPLKVAYETSALSGDVWLADSSGRQWSTGVLQPGGVTWLHVPAETAGRDMHVTVRAIGPGGAASSSVGVTVLPAENSAATSADTNGPPGTNAARISLSKEAVRSGYAFTVRVTGSSGATRVALTDAAGKTLSQSAAGADGIVTMTAPHVRVPATYYVIATVAHGSSEISLVRKLSVVPNPPGHP